jgi:hypothetical protein
MKKPDLLILIAIWEFFTAFGALIAIAAISIFGFTGFLGNWDGWSYNGGRMWDFGSMPGVAIIFGLSVAIFVVFCVLVLAILSGIGILKGKEWGRVTAMVHSVISLFWFPVGTVIGVLSLIYLAKQETKDYFNPPPPKV